MRIASLLILLPLVACDKSKKDLDGDGYIGAEDCDDDNDAVNPGADEVCDGIDNNCDGLLDEGDATDAPTWYGDADGDGFGGETLVMTACEQPSGYLDADNAGDCDDLDATAHPDGVEICDGVDNDCDGLLDGDDDSVDLDTATVWYTDNDGDGYGDDASPVESCSQPAGTAAVGGDCDDNNSALNPETLWYADRDGDGWGDEATTQASCEGVNGFVAVAEDCNDENAWVNPDGQEICGGEDEDCDGLEDDADDSTDIDTMTSYYRDGDSDGYGNEDGTAAVQCDAPSGFVADASDCDDTLGDVNPDGTEVCDDGLDNDCSGDAPECGLSDGDTSTADISISGPATYDYFGWSAAVGDFNGDGTNDIAASAFYADGTACSYCGTAYVFNGPTTATSSGDASTTFEGTSTYDYVGYSIAAGDLDDDGYDDLLIGAYGVDDGGSTSGSVYVAYGSASGWTSGAAADLPSLYGDNSSDYMGTAVSVVGDVNGDGYDDFTVGSLYNADGAYRGGQVYLIAGSATQMSGSTNVSSEALATYTSNTTYTYIGGPGSGGVFGDLDGDGYDEMGITSGDLESDYGGVYINYGAATVTDVDIEDMEVLITGSTYYGYLGDSPTASDDLDGDGYDDLIAGEYYGGSSGAVYVVYGSSTAMAGEYDIEDIAGTWGTGETGGDGFGHTVAAGDLNNDGEVDLTVGAPYYEGSSGNYSEGAAYAFYGPLTTGELDLEAANATLTGTESYGYLGYRGGMVIADVDASGVEDLVVTGYYGSNSYYGGLYAWYGAGM